MAKWRAAMRVVHAACLIAMLVGYVYFRQWLGPLLLFSVIANGISRNREIRFYENGVSLPKAAGEVFLSRSQILAIKLNGDRLIVTGPDADWKGPYSGGVFRIRETDLRRLQEVLARFTRS
jgi:hypothetical protein